MKWYNKVFSVFQGPDHLTVRYGLREENKGKEDEKEIIIGGGGGGGNEQRAGCLLYVYRFFSPGVGWCRN